MDLLKRMEQDLAEKWRLAQSVADARSRGRLLAMYWTLYRQYKRQKEYAAAINGVINER